MGNARTIPSNESKSVVTYTILSDGTEVSRTYNLLSIQVQKELNRVPSATIIFVDGDPSKETFDLSNQPDFEPGKELEIKAGYRSDEETIFKGIVIRHAIKVRRQSAVLVVECRDKAFKMTIAPKSKYFRDVTDSDVMEELIGAYGMDKDVEATSVTHKQMVQYNTTDWDFMLCRADVNGLLCMVGDGKITLKKPELSGSTVLDIQYGSSLHDLDAEIDARLQLKAVKGSTWNHTDQQLLDSVTAADPGAPDPGNITAATLAAVSGVEELVLAHGGRIDEPELQAWADAALLKYRLAKIRGTVRTDGTAAVLPGQMIQMNGIGDRFEGQLFVTGVRHQVEKGNWETVFQFGLEPQWFAQSYALQQPPAGGLLPGVDGLQIGIVTQIEEDPDGEDRIMVRVPVINKDDEGLWCRVSTLDAGAGRGTFFRPEVEDEVVVGFLNNDPRNAVVLGMLHSSAKPAPITAAADNNEKGYVSRSEMKLLFDDDKKSITIETPAGNKIVISEEDKGILLEDENGNKITMNADGINMESAKDIIMKASGDVTVEGTNLNLKGSAQTKIEGGSGAELSSGATTNVKGSMVNIN